MALQGLSAIGLPTEADTELLNRSTDFVRADKKGDQNTLDLVYIQELGKSSVKRLSLEEVQTELIRCGGNS